MMDVEVAGKAPFHGVVVIHDTLGIVENMSYIVCPDCGKKIHIFGEEKLNKVASKYGYELLGNLPMDGKLASLCDKGIIELMENDFLDKAVAVIENKFDQK